jgi:hypothetical protein
MINSFRKKIEYIITFCFPHPVIMYSFLFAYLFSLIFVTAVTASIPFSIRAMATRTGALSRLNEEKKKENCR